MTGDQCWRVRLTAAAESDIRKILQWTAERFGLAQAQMYGETLTRAIQALTAGPHVAGSRRRDEIVEGLVTLHVARGGRKGRHLVLYRVGNSGDRSTIDVLRLLHDSIVPVSQVLSQAPKLTDLRASARGCYGDAGEFIKGLRNEWP